MSAEHSTIKRREIIDRLLKQLTKDDPLLYYASTGEIARALHTMIQEHSSRLHVDEQLIANHMTLQDIERILSYHYKN